MPRGSLSHVWRLPFISLEPVRPVGARSIVFARVVGVSIVGGCTGVVCDTAVDGVEQLRVRAGRREVAHRRAKAATDLALLDGARLLARALRCSRLEATEGLVVHRLPASADTGPTHRIEAAAKESSLRCVLSERLKVPLLSKTECLADGPPCRGKGFPETPEQSPVELLVVLGAGVSERRLALAFCRFLSPPGGGVGVPVREPTGCEAGGGLDDGRPVDVSFILRSCAGWSCAGWSCAGRSCAGWSCAGWSRWWTWRDGRQI